MKVQAVRRVGSKALTILLCVTLMMGLNPASAFATEINQQNAAPASESLSNEDMGEKADAIAGSSEDSSTEETEATDNKVDNSTNSTSEKSEVPKQDTVSGVNKENAKPYTSNGLIEDSNKEEASAEDANENEIALMALGLDTTDTEEDASRTANTATATVSYTTQIAGTFSMAPQNGVTVSGDLAESYGYTDSVTNGVSVLDVLVDAHIRMHGEDFTPETATLFLEIGEYGSASTCFGFSSDDYTYSGFLYNDAFPTDANGNGTTETTQAVHNGDNVTFFFYDAYPATQYLTWFYQDDVYVSSVAASSGSELNLSLKGFSLNDAWGKSADAMHNDSTPIPAAHIGWVNITDGTISKCDNTTDENGNVSVRLPAQAGTYYLTAYYSDWGSEGNGGQLLRTLLPIAVQEVQEPTTDAPKATVSFNVQKNGTFSMAPQIDVAVSGDLSDKYGYDDKIENGVSVLDVLIYAHICKYRERFTPETATNYLELSSSGFVTKIFGEEAPFGFACNDSYTWDEAGMGTTVTNQSVSSGDTVTFFFYQDTSWYMDYYAWFCEDGVYTSSVMSNGTTPLELSVAGYMIAYAGDMFNNANAFHSGGDPIDSARIGWVDIATGAVSECAIADENGVVSVTPPTDAGTYYLTAYYTEEDAEDMGYPLIMPLLKVTVDPSYIPPVKNPSGLSNLEVKSFSYDNFDYYALALDPAFDTNILKYTAGTLNYAEENKRILYVTATTISPTAQITATLNDGSTTVLTSGTQKIMADKPKPGMNKLVVTVTTDSGSTEYTVRVKMTDPNAPSVPSNDDIEAATVSTGAYLPTVVTNPTFNSLAGEWAVIGQMRGEFDGADEFASTYAKNLAAELARTNGVLSKNTYTDYSRVVLALTACGYDVTDFAGYNLLQPLADIDAVMKQGINGPIWALIALDSHAYEIPIVDSPDKTQTTRNGLIEAIINRQLNNGGWAIGGESLNIDMTAMALIALAPYANSSNPNVEATVDKALAGISDYLNDPSNADAIEGLGPDSYAQLISALCACGIDLEDSRFGIDGKSPMSKLLSFANQDGSFSRTEGGSGDLRATEQSLLALIACKRYLNGSNPLYNMSDVVIDKHQAATDPKPTNPEDPTDPEQPSNPEDPTDPEQPSNPNDNNSQGSSANGSSDNNSGAGSQTPLSNSLSPQGRTSYLSAPQDDAKHVATTDQIESEDAIAESNTKAISDTEIPLDRPEKNGESFPFIILGIALIVLGVIGVACILTFVARHKRSPLNR